MSPYEKAAIKAADIAQTKYKDTPLHKPWPDWEKAREIAHKEFILFLKQNENANKGN